MEINKIYNEDCLVGMKKIPDASVDCIICDLPYGVLNKKSGGCVLDNCMGSGTTAIAAIREKRNFIGFELNKEYYDKACKRIKLEMMQPSLF